MCEFSELVDRHSYEIATNIPRERGYTQNLFPLDNITHTTFAGTGERQNEEEGREERGKGRKRERKTERQRQMQDQ